MSFILCYLMFHLVVGTALGGCSQKCHPDPPSAEDNSTSNSPPQFPCSCSPSCSVYRDCCFDSDYRDSNRTVKWSDTMCVTVNGTGKFSSVAKCPSHWNQSSHFCAESIGYLPPVTSKTTGVTYANLYCAVCHGDGENLDTWNVELRCCPEHENDPDRYFSYRHGQLWSRLPKSRGGGRCLCRYHTHDDSPFVAGPDLRRCDIRRETATCSSSWPADETSRLCPLYKDPVYSVDDAVYKNPHCARCNFEEDPRCLPAVVATMFEAGADFAEVSRHCRENQINVCLHYIDAMGRGVEYSFSRILKISTASCVPEPGERCCEGYRYHYKTKMCRKLAS